MNSKSTYFVNLPPRNFPTFVIGRTWSGIQASYCHCEGIARGNLRTLKTFFLLPFHPSVISDLIGNPVLFANAWIACIFRPPCYINGSCQLLSSSCKRYIWLYIIDTRLQWVIIISTLTPIILGMYTSDHNIWYLWRVGGACLIYIRNGLPYGGIGLKRNRFLKRTTTSIHPFYKNWNLTQILLFHWHTRPLVLCFPTKKKFPSKNGIFFITGMNSLRIQGPDSMINITGNLSRQSFHVLTQSRGKPFLNRKYFFMIHNHIPFTVISYFTCIIK